MLNQQPLPSSRPKNVTSFLTVPDVESSSRSSRTWSNTCSYTWEPNRFSASMPLANPHSPQNNVCRWKVALAKRRPILRQHITSHAKYSKAKKWFISASERAKTVLNVFLNCMYFYTFWVLTTYSYTNKSCSPRYPYSCPDNEDLTVQQGGPCYPDSSPQARYSNIMSKRDQLESNYFFTDGCVTT